jgi:hypothetical protein
LTVNKRAASELTRSSWIKLKLLSTRPLSSD